MPRCYLRYRQATQEIVEAEFQPITTLGTGEATADIGQQAQVPDFRLHRYDGAGGVRPSTAAELAIYDSATSQQRERMELDEKKLRALIVWLAGKFGLSPAAARQEIISIYRSL